jgi:hypothetical protein
LRTRRNIVVLLVFALAAGASWSTARALETPQGSVCRSPLTGVHDPTRLQILNPCATFVGTVVKTPKQFGDGDFAFNVAPDAAYASMLNAKNRSQGGLHVEIIPLDQGHGLRPPALHAHIRITGAHVYDRWTGWNEIHPAWKIESGSGGSPPPPPPPPSPLAVFHLKAQLSGKALGRVGARHGRGHVALTLKAATVCWRFTRLAKVGRPTRAAIRFKQSGKPGRSVLTLGRRYERRGCVSTSEALFESLVEEPGHYHVLVASRRHRYGALRGRLKTTQPRPQEDLY